MSKPVKWAGWSSTVTYKNDGSIKHSVHHFHASNNPKNCIWIDMPQVDEAVTMSYVFYPMSPYTNRAEAKKYLAGLTTDKEVLDMLAAKEVRAKRGSRQKITAAEQEERTRQAHANMKSALE
jgi:hypothetical protein